MSAPTPPNPKDKNDFYVGYLSAPAWAVRTVWLSIIVLIGLVLADAYVVTQIQQAPGPGRWADTRTVLRGVLSREPYPVLWVQENGTSVPHILIADSKRGAETVLGGIADGAAEIKGALIVRSDLPNVRMFEVAAGDAKSLNDSLQHSSPVEQSFASITLKGEIVDSKCWFGVMRPGEGHVHKGCATVCILGGIPPVLITRNADGTPTGYVLTDDNGHQIDPNRIRSLVGDAITISGQVRRKGGLIYLRADLKSLARL